MRRKHAKKKKKNIYISIPYIHPFVLSKIPIDSTGVHLSTLPSGKPRACAIVLPRWPGVPRVLWSLAVYGESGGN